MKPAAASHWGALPIVDIGGLNSPDQKVRAAVAQAIRDACLDKGFFYCVGHGVDADLMGQVFEQARLWFDRPLPSKLALDKAKSTANRGYEPLRGQVLEPGAPPDLKEGFYIGVDVPADDPRALVYFNLGPNQWPQDQPQFRPVMEAYFNAALGVVRTLLRGLALSLHLPEDHFTAFATDPVATLRLLHYPPQPPHPAPGEKGCGAHTDFGALTLLLQDDVGGLQVWDHGPARWIDVAPLPGAYLVNLGDLIARWTNGRYRSTLHRVINSSGRERYSVPFFFLGAPDQRIEPLPGCLTAGETPRYPPVTVDAHLRERYAQTYG
ncbi:MAG: 2-oxoglutarate and iron-dependent oxygenase domain-containing protein [Caulobacteraceae bacterium]